MSKHYMFPADKQLIYECENAAFLFGEGQSMALWTKVHICYDMVLWVALFENSSERQNKSSDFISLANRLESWFKFYAFSADDGRPQTSSMGFD